MLNFFTRASVSRLVDPIGHWLVRRGLSPNVVTVIGTVATAAAALWFYPRGELFVGTVVVTVFLFFDLLDGAMARTLNRATSFGAVLDASCDRIADAVLFGSLVWWALVVDDNESRGLGLLVCLGGAQVISYVKARAEANGLTADGGVAERAERFVVILVAVGLHGLGVPYVLDAAIWLLVLLIVLTVVQRLVRVHSPRART
ncbi:CDP-alcohol phosphatidyltransferase family protein [Allosaccharopolyspora coralli]|uniref:Phosphatidylinositol phosphate synthase n=1 Tax=Allosaccharopolyspora coralli TaxID=2665642 RepID=A0A5Q3Q701_9PSEU|nr:CDP-alcohol phosphatidyltransferase family protein [Allosaccharopolyspora coralli]QGK69620.1 CDP-alcohol phosphatidyltransferase family protein [Allosaccharopolyspora coralli]